MAIKSGPQCQFIQRLNLSSLHRSAAAADEPNPGKDEQRTEEVCCAALRAVSVAGLIKRTEEDYNSI